MTPKRQEVINLSWFFICLCFSKSLLIKCLKFFKRLNFIFLCVSIHYHNLRQREIHYKNHTQWFEHYFEQHVYICKFTLFPSIVFCGASDREPKTSVFKYMYIKPESDLLLN